MKTRFLLLPSTFVTAMLAILLSVSARAASSAIVDDFSAADHTTGGAGRLVITDKDAGSQSHATQRCENGILKVDGELVPGRGAPAFISLPLLLTPDGKPQ